ncbi:isopentenyl-diphosphate delta-isomerase [Amaricoccus macauensis]|uniref:Isopentenyl-diphosphate Delta-isomerase n=1 Tax=Amaricoccus macauensis TaxID=57001 RepID=A0A840SDZ8_9RHOB|nr:isopentenyl-diphosphate delta-isomerase [Amaricoccus macauensis]MBB5221089.1 isopentenyl-diphosphate delta-isomerase [Amaricoccus macauensis]
MSRISDDLIPAWTPAGLEPMPKLEVHRRGLLHPAVSVFVIAGTGGDLRTLLQRRAAGKYHSGLLWANACCTHPRWDEPPLDCAHRRLSEELGITGLDLVWRERLTYRAEVGGGLIEHEEVDVFVARCEAEPTLDPDPAEVSDLRWVSLDALGAEIAANPAAFAPWLRIYLERSAGRIFGELTPDQHP